jgi:hypothetical protein
MLSISGLRKYLSVIVLMFFIFNIVGYYLWFSYVKNNIQKEVRQEIRRGLAEKDLTLITVPIGDESGIRWIKPGKEFTFRGEMYDVVKIKILKDKKIYSCINDTKEKKLIADFAKNNESSSKTKRLLGHFHYTYIIQPDNLFHIIESSNHDYCIKSFELESAVKEVTLPPPKFFFQA